MEQQERRINFVCIGEGAHLHVHLVAEWTCKRCKGGGAGDVDAMVWGHGGRACKGVG
jgi:hypothetical protein